MKAKYLILILATALMGCSNMMKPQTPGVEKIREDIQGSVIGNIITSWRFAKDDKYSRFAIVDSAVFDKDAIINISAIGEGSGGRCFVMSFEAHYKLDDSNEWKFIQAISGNKGEMQPYPMDHPKCQP